jgi:hypothetical protein
MQWVTVKGVKIDRTGCAWLIRRFIDPEAEFTFVEKDAIEAEVEKGARAFHNFVFTGTPRTYSSFQQLVMEQGLDGRDPALVLMGESLRAGERAGWQRNGCENEGLWAIANGNSTLARDDADMIERMLPVYDALYAYCQQRAEGKAGWASDR